MVDPPRWLLSLLFRPARLFFVCVVLALASVQLSFRTQQHNPNSHFFDPTPDTFEGVYSNVRKAQARTWIETMDTDLQGGGGASSSSAALPPLYKSSHTPPELSVVFVAVRRPKEQYLDIAVGSFLMDIPAEQRKHIHVALSLGEDDPNQQPFFHRAWAHGLVDEVAVRKIPEGGAYLPPALVAHSTTRPTAKLIVMPRPAISLANKDVQTKEWHQRGASDYALALELCAKHAAPYCLIVEDDVVFAANWFEYFQRSLRKAEQWTSTTKGSGSKTGKAWAYMRLFYAEKYFGWENDEVQTLVVCSASVVVAVALLLILFGRVPARYAALAGVSKRTDLLHSHRHDRDDIDMDERKVSLTTGRRSDTGRVARVRLPLGTQLLFVVMTLFYCVLFILSGRNHVYKVPRGVSEMNSRGCCTQAMLYPFDVVAPLASHLHDRNGVRPYDILINRWVSTHDRVKLAVHPPLVQHIGFGSTQSMVDETYLRSTPLWSFAFEKLSAKLNSTSL